MSAKTKADLLRFARWCRDHDETPGVLVYAHNADDIEEMLKERDELLAALKMMAALVGEQDATEEDDGSIYALAVALDAIGKAEGYCPGAVCGAPLKLRGHDFVCEREPGHSGRHMRHPRVA